MVRDRLMGQPGWLSMSSLMPIGRNYVPATKFAAFACIILKML